MDGASVEAEASKMCCVGLSEQTRIMRLRFHCGLRVAGQPDLLMKTSDGRIVVVDWKRSKTIRMENERANMKHPLQHLTAANFWAYALQVTGVKRTLSDWTHARLICTRGRTHPKESR